MRAKREDFDSMHQMFSTFDKRPNNAIMQNCNSSDSGSQDFTFSRDYAHAVEIARFGDKKLAESIIKDKKKIDKITGISLRQKTKNDIVGFVPIVPNTLQNIPINMVNNNRVPTKTKTVKILWSMCENCNISAKEIQDACMTLLQAVQILELNDIRVELSSTLMATESHDEFVMGTLKVKGYREKLDITRLSGTVGHPSFFRRVGFKWLETYPELTDDGYRFGYGRSIIRVDYQGFKELLQDNEVLITLDVVRMVEFDSPKLVEYIRDVISQNKSSKRMQRI